MVAPRLRCSVGYLLLRFIGLRMSAHDGPGPTKAPQCVMDRAEELKDTVESIRFQRDYRIGIHRREPHITIALHGFFKAAEQESNRISVHLSKLGAIKHDHRAIHIDTAFEFATKL